MCVLIGLAACGGGGSSGASVATFIGTWSVTSGTYTLTCPDSSPQPSQISDPVTWTSGTNSALEQTLPGTSCVLHANISGSVAMGLPRQTCSVDSTLGGGAVTEMLSFTTYSFTVADDGLTAQASFSGIDMVADATGSTSTCTFAQAASYAKQ
jgi:hypothetical protein